MKKMQIVAMLLAVVLMITVVPATTAFAVTASGTNSVTRLWNSQTVTVSSGSYVDLPSFTADGNYIAFEVCGTDSNGASCSGVFTVSLRRLTSSITSVSATANGSITKKDWVSITDGCSYFFRVANNSNQTLKVTVTWYTWY